MHVTVVGLISMFAALTAAEPRLSRRGTGVAVPIRKDSWLTKADKSVDIEALNSHVASVKAKVLRGSRNFDKNTGHPRPAASTGDQRRGTGSDGLTEYKRKLWYGTMSVGTPPVNFTVDFDTGSSDIFLPGPECGSSCSGHTIYNPKSSSTSQVLSQEFSLEFEDNSTVTGNVYSDMVTVAGLTAQGQTLGTASKYSSGFERSQFPADGLMGMAFQSISAYQASPFFQTLVSQGQVNEAAFSFKLASSGAELYLGGADSLLYTGDFTYAPLTQVSCDISVLGLNITDGDCPGYWKVKMDSIQGNGRTIFSNNDSVIDTGSTGVVGDFLSVATLHSVLGGTDASSTVGQGYYTFPCGSFPNVSLTFGGRAFPISTETLNLGQISLGSTNCLSGIVGSDVAFWIVGDVFLQNVYTKFDVGNERVGFAQLV